MHWIYSVIFLYAYIIIDFQYTSCTSLISVSDVSCILLCTQHCCMSCQMLSNACLISIKLMKTFCLPNNPFSSARFTVTSWSSVFLPGLSPATSSLHNQLFHSAMYQINPGMFFRVKYRSVFLIFWRTSILCILGWMPIFPVLL